MRSTHRDTPVSVVRRVSAVLGAFRPNERYLGVSEIARRTGLAKSTVSRLVQELVAVDILERGEGAVRLGIRLFELGEHATRPKDLKRAALEHMVDLGRATNHTVHLAVLERGDVVYIQILRAQRGPRLPSQVGGRMPAHATGLGKAMLAHAGEAAVSEVIARGLRPVGPRTITDGARLRAELDRIRTNEIAYEREESGSDVACAASAILSSSGRAVAAVSVSGWSGRLDVVRVGPAVRLAALGIARMLERPTPVSPPDYQIETGAQS